MRVGTRHRVGAWGWSFWEVPQGRTRRTWVIQIIKQSTDSYLSIKQHHQFIIAMSTRNLPRQNKIDLNLAQYYEAALNYLPNIFVHPLQLLTLVLQIINFALQVGLFLVLMAQTAHVLGSSEKRYINLRHLLIKWMGLIIMLMMEQYIKKHTLYSQLFTLFINLLGLLMIYPSKFIKDLHLKYFSLSERKKYDQSEEDPSNYEMTITTRMLISITLFFLNSSRLIITFVPLHHRKKIEQAMKAVNMVIVEEKYFWKMYESAWSNTSQEPTNSILLKNDSAKDFPRTTNNSKASTRQNIIRSKGTQFIKVDISTLPDSKKKFTFFRNVQLIYNIETNQLTLTQQGEGKAEEHLLDEVSIIDENMLELFCHEDQIYIKFKAKKDMQLFLNAISMDGNDIIYHPYK